MATQNRNFKVKNGLDVSGAISATSTISASGLAGSLLASTPPNMDGSASAGTSTVPARADHTHPTDTSVIPKSLVSDAGQVIASSAANTPVAVGVGTSDGQVLTWDSASVPKMKWAAVSGGSTIDPLFLAGV